MEKKKKKILIIDDDEAFGQAIGTFLQSQNYDTGIALTGREGVEMAQSDPPDLILLDVRLPEEDGLSVLRKLKRRTDPVTGESSLTRDIPVIVLTGHAEQMEDAFLMEQAAEFLLKPVDRKSLIASIQKALAGKN